MSPKMSRFPNVNPANKRKARWRMEKDNVVRYVYADQCPLHMTDEGYMNIRAAGFYDEELNCIVDDEETATVFIDDRKAPGS